MNALSNAAPNAGDWSSMLSLDSAVPASVLFGRSFWGGRNIDLPPSTPAESFTYSAVQTVSGAVTVTSAVALPTIEEWRLVRVDAVPARAALLAALWHRLMRSMRKAVARDDDEATSVSAETIKHALRLLGELPEIIELPQATVSADGEVIFTWFRFDNRMEAILAPDHYLTWVFRLDGKVTDGDVVALGGGGSLDIFYKAVADFYA